MMNPRMLIQPALPPPSTYIRAFSQHTTPQAPTKSSIITPHIKGKGLFKGLPILVHDPSSKNASLAEKLIKPRKRKIKETREKKYKSSRGSSPSLVTPGKGRRKPVKKLKSTEKPTAASKRIKSSVTFPIFN